MIQTVIHIPPIEQTMNSDQTINLYSNILKQYEQSIACLSTQAAWSSRFKEVVLQKISSFLDFCETHNS